MDKLKSLTIFMRSAQCGSFSEAARQLGMAPSAVSRAVLRLSLFCHSPKTFAISEF
ncbi:LysR family transcriptional regulator [Nostoc sp.]|uniref:LysR family transcriptional regulator n=1 Tax=Nostoc sp. TaxID=1180 RepID=UPI003FA587C2